MVIELKPGDIVSCAIRSGIIVSSYGTYDEIRSFAIITAYENYGYYLFVPCYITLNNSEIADTRKCKEFSIEMKYLNESIVWIVSSVISSVVSINKGMICKNCKESCLYAEPNQFDGSFICYSCRNNRYV